MTSDDILDTVKADERVCSHPEHDYWLRALVAEVERVREELNIQTKDCLSAIEECRNLRQRHAEELERLEDEHARYCGEQVTALNTGWEQRHAEAVEAAYKAGRRDGIVWQRGSNSQKANLGETQHAAWLASEAKARLT